MEMRNQFKFKDKVTDKFKQSLVLYRINCSEHVYKPKPEAKTKNKNAPYKHSVATGHTIDYEGIELINRADSNFKLCIKEKLHIVEDKPDMNTLCTNEFELKTLIF